MSTIVDEDYILGWKPITGLPVVLKISTGLHGVTGDSAILALVLEDDAIEAVIDTLWGIGQTMADAIAFPHVGAPLGHGPYLGMMGVRIGDYYGHRPIDVPRVFVIDRKAILSLRRELRYLLETARQFGHAAGGWYPEPEQLS